MSQPASRPTAAPPPLGAFRDMVVPLSYRYEKETEKQSCSADEAEGKPKPHWPLPTPSNRGGAHIDMVQAAPMPRNDGQHGWTPSRGIPPAARSSSVKTDAQGFTASATGARPTRKQPASPRSGGNAGASRVRGGVDVPSKRDGMQGTRTNRHSRGGAKRAEGPST